MNKLGTDNRTGTHEQLVFVMDASASMTETITGYGGKTVTKLQAGRSAVKSWATWLPGSRLKVDIAVVAFSDRPSVLSLWCHPRSPRLYTRLNGIRTGAMTDIGGALELARDLLERRQPPRRIILLTDGDQNVSGAPDPKKVARQCRRSLGITTDVIALGESGVSYEPRTMKWIAKEGGGTYYEALSLEELVTAFKSLYRGRRHP